MAGAPSVAATRSESRAPRSPPTVPAPVICPNRRLAVRGSKRSVAISQNAEVSKGPIAEVCRNSSVAVAAGALEPDHPLDEEQKAARGGKELNQRCRGDFRGPSRVRRNKKDGAHRRRDEHRGQRLKTE